MSFASRTAVTRWSAIAAVAMPPAYPGHGDLLLPGPGRADDIRFGSVAFRLVYPCEDAMYDKQIGHIVRVDSGEVEVLISSTEREVTHEGRTHRVGQLGSYVVLPSPDRSIIGFVVGAGREEATHHDDSERLVIRVQLLGEIKDDRFRRGVNDYPIVGDPVHVATREEFDDIFGSLAAETGGSTDVKSFVLGRFAYDVNFPVQVMGSPLFCKHVAVLGNSGSGKSCTTAKILQEVLEMPGSRVVLFDMHGEYRAAFSDSSGAMHSNVTYLGVDDLVLPYWLLKYEELEALFVDRSNPLNVSTQISFLRTALLEFKQDAAKALGLTRSLTLDTPIFFSLEKLKTYAENLNEARFVLNEDHLAFSQLALRSLNPDEQQKLMRTKRCRFNRGNPEGETPHPLYFGKLLGLIDQIDTKFNDRRYEFLLKPIEHGRASRFFRDHLSEVEDTTQTSSLMSHLIKRLTGSVTPRSNLTIVDLSGIPFEIVDITVAVIARLLFDLNFWTPADHRHPILLAFEEAHNYIPRNERGQGFAKAAVERVVKEGRKYGVSAMVISQRPAELSETVLAQCNSFLVLRLSNPEDQRYATKVVGDQFAGLIQMLPVLRPGEVFVLGDSVVMPMRTLVDMPDPAPASGDMDFFKRWSVGLADDDIDETIAHWRRQDRQHVADDYNPLPADFGVEPDSQVEGDRAEEVPEPAGSPPPSDTLAAPRPKPRFRSPYLSSIGNDPPPDASS